MLERSASETGAGNAPLLSIVTGFYNSMGKCARFLQTMRSLTASDVEFILVDDGSTDDTLEFLKAQRRDMRCSCTVIAQDNRGPGGGRNSGVKRASGRYVWFVDADDDFEPMAIDVVRALADADYDFIDFGIKRFEGAGPVRPSVGARAGELEVSPGEHRIEEVRRLFLLRHIGWLVTKVFRRQFLLDSRIPYPEYCNASDIYLFFLLPFVVRRFYKSEVVGYHHYQDQESVTRGIGRKGPRFYDRLHIAVASLDRALKFDVDTAERKRLIDKFNNIFLFHTLEMLRASGDWAMVPRVMRFHREEMETLGLLPLRWQDVKRRLGWLGVCAWLLSYGFPAQRRYFEAVRSRTWGHPIRYPDRSDSTN